MICDGIGEISTGAKVATKFSRSLGSIFFRVVVLEGLLDGRGRNRRRTSWKVGEARDVGSLTCERGGLKKKKLFGVSKEALNW